MDIPPKKGRLPEQREPDEASLGGQADRDRAGLRQERLAKNGRLRP